MTNFNNFALSKALSTYLVLKNLYKRFIILVKVSNNKSGITLFYVSSGFPWSETAEGGTYWATLNDEFNSTTIFDLDLLFVPNTEIVCTTIDEVTQLFKFLTLAKLTWASGDSYNDSNMIIQIKEIIEDHVVSFNIAQGVYCDEKDDNVTYVSFSDAVIGKEDRGGLF